jgi:hypothetical protein
LCRSSRRTDPSWRPSSTHSRDREYHILTQTPHVTRAASDVVLHCRPQTSAFLARPTPAISYPYDSDIVLRSLALVPFSDSTQLLVIASVSSATSSGNTRRDPPTSEIVCPSGHDGCTKPEPVRRLVRLPTIGDTYTSIRTGQGREPSPTPSLLVPPTITVGDEKADGASSADGTSIDRPSSRGSMRKAASSSELSVPGSSSQERASEDKGKDDESSKSLSKEDTMVCAWGIDKAIRRAEIEKAIGRAMRSPSGVVLAVKRFVPSRFLRILQCP